MSPSHYDTIVAGVGGVGSSALFHLAQRGLRVLGIDRFAPGHSRGSSHGETRVIRKAYFEHPDYVPLLQAAYQNWRQLEAACGESLLFETGLLEVGPADGMLISGVQAAAHQYDLPLEVLDPQEVPVRFPGFQVPAGHAAVYEAEGGYLRVEACIEQAANVARQQGVDLAIGHGVDNWSVQGSIVHVDFGPHRATCDRLIITAGAWASQLLGHLGIPLRVVRKHLHWYATQPGAYTDGKSPVFFYETPAGCYYGFPSRDGASLKIAEHTGGEPVADPLMLNRSLDRTEQSRVESFLEQHLSALAHDSAGRLREVQHATCMYTLTPDEHFVVDRHPEFPQVCFAAGLSGHGFKFASVLGEILADLAQHGQTRHPIEFLGCQRFLEHKS